MFSVGATLSCAMFATALYAADVKVTLSGDQEAPPVKTSATGSGTLTVGDDKSISGGVTTTGIVGTAAHIHEGAPGKSTAESPVRIPMVKNGDNGWNIPPGTKMNDDVYAAYKAGNLFVNVHSAANKTGELRGQLKP
jgi:hypothetical protein